MVATPGMVIALVITGGDRTRLCDTTSDACGVNTRLHSEHAGLGDITGDTSGDNVRLSETAGDASDYEHRLVNAAGYGHALGDNIWLVDPVGNTCCFSTRWQQHLAWWYPVHYTQ